MNGSGHTSPVGDVWSHWQAMQVLPFFTVNFFIVYPPFFPIRNAELFQSFHNTETAIPNSVFIKIRRLLRRVR